MIYTKDIRKALNFMYEAHQGQQDKSGVPYVFHPFTVALKMEDEKTTIVALLHDVVEDTPHTLEDIRRLGFSEDVVEAIGILTWDRTIPYMDYIRKVKQNPLARAVKLADLEHNSDLTRLDFVDEVSLKRVEKYQEARKLLL